MDKISSELEVMEQLLRKYDNTARANSISEYRALLKESESLFWSKIDSLDWWGGPGSMADYFLHADSGIQSADEQKNDNRRFRAALTAIYRGMIQAGKTNEKGKFWAETFTIWQENNL